MRVLLISTYELGRQPLHVASPAAALRRAGHDVSALDLSVDAWDAAADEAVAWADAVAVSVPMHTAMRLGVEVAQRVRAARPGLPVAFYGLYAGVSHDELGIADAAFVGEYEPALLEWVGGVEPQGAGVVVHLGRSDLAVPDRRLLPPLDRYARLAVADRPGEHLLVGAVDASHGCNQRCRHCPVPAVYDGRTRTVDVETVMADVEALAGAGAQHITFGDPDFFSGPAHGVRVVQEFARRFPTLTFDVTTKVEHVLRHAEVWPAMADAGCRFVVSAVECLDDAILALLDKGHTAAEADEAVRLLLAHGIEPHPSFLPFTPWTTPEGVLDILAFVARHDLVGVVDPVQYSLRLLLPPGSLLLGVPEIEPHLAGYDPGALTWRWRAADPQVDTLQADLAALVEARMSADPSEVFAEVWELVARAAGVEVEVPEVGMRPTLARLSEPWFCCAEPTGAQVASVAAPSVSPSLAPSVEA
ncbi:MAG TPA: CUAEP/CCAEP-tail radical SAM protein [Acidimicrobiia bacterium]|nr:CUAEP/CCAEP-tail radical SAM protein [Acidimicrobiia bacterium]